MMYLCNLPLKSLRLVQRTLSTGLRAVNWHNTQQPCHTSLTHVSLLHFLIHFTSPRLPYRRIHIQDLLQLCGFDDNVNLSEAMLTLLACIGTYKECAAPIEPTDRRSFSYVQPNELHALRIVPLSFWQLCQGILAFRLQRPNNLPVSINGIYSWNLNSWFPDASSNTHKSWVVRTMLKSAPVLLQETKWNQAQLQHLLHTWPEIRVIAILAQP